ncbi:hypothetical protein ENSA5_33490 [Enhygromyxa salina]|uniref:Uncharacterized protein n=1 Tax=Enhygromyxa salina TaxID=215803 RepID=A0A2S9XXE5_9BACT|nr:hypothetical protein [Enhygromyxa salina]PRP97513.1 hypothetical protein ENSA5_33490 [Enhygromyxa salina]
MSPPDQPPASTPVYDSPATGLVPASDRDRPINLGFEAYHPVRPIPGKVRGENLLWHSLLHAGLLDAWDDALHAIQRRLGRDRTIWGVFLDLDSGALAWELRVLARGSAPDIVDTLRETLAPWLELAPGVAATPESAVVGLRFDAQTMSRGRVDAVELHERATESRETAVFRVSAEARELVSRDLVLEPKRHIDEVLPAIKRSEVVNFAADKRLLGRVLIPELFACQRLHISKRRGRDALCFSGVNVEQLAFTYKRFEYPKPMLAFLTEHQAELEHLLYDVSVEYREREGRIVYPTTGFWGSL